MKKQIQLDDAFDGEKAELSDELYEALGELRPDPDEFREGVQDRIDAAEANASAVPPEKLSSFARRAASFFPPVLLGKGAAKFGVGAPVAAKVGTKLVPGLLVFPVVSIIMVCFTLLIGLKTVFIRANGQQRQDRDEANIDTKLWWGRFWLPFALMTVLSFILMFKVPGDAFALLITISTLSFLGVYASLVRAGLGTRREVGMRASVAMGWLLGMSVNMARPGRINDSIAYGWLVPLFLIIGVTFCAILGKPEAKSHRKGYRLRTPLLLLGGSVLFATVLGLSRTNDKKAATYEDVRAWIASYEAGEDDEDRCYEVPRVERIVTNFYAAGKLPFDLRVLGRAAREGLKGALKSGSFNTLCAASFARLGFLEDADYENFIDEDAVEAMLSSRRMHLAGDHDLPALLAHLHFESLSYQERHLIAGKAIATLDPTRNLANTKDVLWIIHYLDALGLSERVQELAQPAHEILKRTWCRVVSGKEACFTPYPTSAERDEDGAITETSTSSAWGEATSRAVYLIKRLGVPEFLSASDLAALDAYLLDNSRQFEQSEIRRSHAEAVSARTLLHTLPEWEEPGTEPVFDEYSVQRILEFRVAIAAALLVIFSLLLTLRAPRESAVA